MIDRDDFEYILKCLDAQRMYVAARILMAYFIESKLKTYFNSHCHASFSLLQSILKNTTKNKAKYLTK